MVNKMLDTPLFSQSFILKIKYSLSPGTCHLLRHSPVVPNSLGLGQTKAEREEFHSGVLHGSNQNTWPSSAVLQCVHQQEVALEQS